jgi:hypothetical protein
MYIETSAISGNVHNQFRSLRKTLRNYEIIGKRKFWRQKEES